MRDRYYRLLEATDLPEGAILVRIWRGASMVLACIEGDEEQEEAAPDLVLFRAALLRLRGEYTAIFVLLNDAALWQAGWGDLVDYRVTRKDGRPALRFRAGTGLPVI
ncbi:hypothetical protein [uncultured Devosia sp.]|uniref:hypothetical protein n=1 Tax=uncultured Devosia sp. TaxID=211434 RepID=UPI0026289EBD|nr:hypothetical protein [uncultured Devosia sp.]